jgi:hypothetical protein
MEDIIFVSAHPDVPYFHWQTKLYIHNFIQKGIEPKNIHTIFSTLNNNKLSEGAIELKHYGINVHSYKDERKIKISISLNRELYSLIKKDKVMPSRIIEDLIRQYYGNKNL